MQFEQPKMFYSSITVEFEWFNPENVPREKYQLHHEPFYITFDPGSNRSSATRVEPLIKEYIRVNEKIVYEVHFIPFPLGDPLGGQTTLDSRLRYDAYSPHRQMTLQSSNHHPHQINNLATGNGPPGLRDQNSRLNSGTPPCRSPTNNDSFKLDRSALHWCTFKVFIL